MKRRSFSSKVFIWKVIYTPWAVTWREWNVQVICAGKVYMYIISLYVTMTSIFTWKVKWLRNSPSGHFRHVSPPFHHMFPHVSPSVSPVWVFPMFAQVVSPCFLFWVLRKVYMFDKFVGLMCIYKVRIISLPCLNITLFFVPCCVATGGKHYTLYIISTVRLEPICQVLVNKSNIH